MPRPEIGRPLPRAADAYVEQPKWHGYVLANDGHGQEWRRVFRVGRSQADELWQTVARAVLDAPVTEVRTGPRGVGCGIHMILSFNGRTAAVIVGWFYDNPDDAPRLVTAFPSP